MFFSTLDSLPPYKPLPRAASPFAPDDIIQRTNQQKLIGRFNDMFSVDRLEAMATLRLYSDDHENNQRIIFAAVQVSRRKNASEENDMEKVQYMREKESFICLKFLPYLRLQTLLPCFNTKHWKLTISSCSQYNAFLFLWYC